MCASDVMEISIYDILEDSEEELTEFINSEPE